MNTVVFVAGGSFGNVFESIIDSYIRVFEQFGFEAIAIRSSVDMWDRLTEILKSKPVYFVVSFVGMGQDLSIKVDEQDKTIWEVLEVPFIALHGDSPAYFYDRHRNFGKYSAMLYGFADHQKFRKRLPDQSGIFGTAPPYAFDRVPLAELDLKAKENGKLYFLKNGNDPQQIKELWVEKLPFYISQALLELADALCAQMHLPAAPDVDAMVVEYFRAYQLDVEPATKLRLFFVAQLDDYLRREKSTLLGRVLSKFPVEIRGHNWEHMDFSAAACTYIEEADYATSRELMKTGLGIIDMSPNTEFGFHDRPVRAFGLHTLCLSNEQAIMRETFDAADYAAISYNFDAGAIEAKVSDVLANPRRYVALGVSMAQQFNQSYTEQRFAESLIRLADAMRIGDMTKYISGMQKFFVWPPQSI